MFYNTNRETGDTLAQSQKKAETQTQRVLAFFQSHKGQAFGPSRVCTELFNDSVPLTSVRRAITDLTTAEHLEKTWVMVQGRYGKKENTWMFSE